MTRRTATLVWAGMLVVPFAFMAVAFRAAQYGVGGGLREPLFWLAVLASAGNLVLSRLLPPRLGPPRANDRDAVAFARVVVSLALAEAAALAPLVAFMLTRDARLLGLLALDVLALVVLFPSEGRWHELLPDPDRIIAHLIRLYRSGAWSRDNLFPFNEYVLKLRPGSRQVTGCAAPSGTTPRAKPTSIATARLTKLPRSFARSALSRSTSASSEKAASRPNGISRIRK